MDDLQSRLDALFLEELQDNLRALTEGIVALERGAGDETVVVRELFRAAHSLKGAAHSAGVTSAVTPCHRLEELLAEARDDVRPVDGALIASLLEGVDALATVERSLREAAGGGQAGEGVTAGPGGDGEPAPPSPNVRLANGNAGRARVAVGRLDQLVNRAGALVSAAERVNALAADLAAARRDAASPRRGQRPEPDGDDAADDETTAANSLGPLARRADALARELRRLVSEVGDTALQLRLQPFSDVVAGLERSIRELSQATQTEARLVISGGDVEVDRDIGDALREPLLHLLRNAVDHGIEPPEQRAAAGKPSTGTVHVSATTEASLVTITVADDGAGLDLAALRQSAERLGAPPPADDAADLVFLPGLTTASTVTDVSGRGVGLDAVRDRVESLGGTVHVRSRPGRGTDVEIHVPRSLAVLRVVVAQAGEEVIAVPAAGVRRLHHITWEGVEHLEGRLVVDIVGHRVPCVPLAVALQVGDVPAPSSSPMIGMEVVGEDGALLIDGVHSELDVVVLPLPPRLEGVAGILGAAVLPSGRTALVINPAATLRSGLSTPAAPLVADPRTRRTTVLLAEDTLTTRALERSILERAGYDVIVAADGAEAWELLRQGHAGGRSIDVVVTDVDMPRMGGIELCRAIRSSSHLSDLPVVLVTSLSRQEDRQRGVDAGANAYIVKSAFEQRALLDAVGRLV